MITGAVNADREAIILLSVRDVGGQEQERDVIVDTGFNGWLTLPSDFIAALGLRWQRFGRAMLADASETVFNIYEAVVLWDGQPVTIPVDELDAEPLVGMSLMYGYELVVHAVDGGSVTLRRM